MDEFDSSKNKETISKANIKFNKKKKSNKWKVIVFGALYLAIATFSGIITAIVISYDDSKYYESYNVENISSNSLINLNNQEEKTKYSYEIKKAAQSVVSIMNVKENDGIITESNCGVGVAIKDEGYILTNYHLIEDAKQIKVKLYNEEIYYGQIVGVEKTYDLAVIKIPTENLSSALIVDSSQVKNGDEVIVIGNREGRQFNEYIQTTTITNINEPSFFINRQDRLTTALKVLKVPKNPNNIGSGSALCNSNGQLIGISNMYINYIKGDKENTYYISSNDLLSILKDIINKESDLISTLGINGEEAVPKNSEGVEGFYIREVKKGSYAYNAGIRPTDIIVEINHIPIRNVDDINKILLNNTSDSIECVIFKNGNYVTSSVKLKNINK